jgi:hypothetical protein
MAIDAITPRPGEDSTSGNADRGSTVAESIAQAYLIVPGLPDPLPSSGWVAIDPAASRMDSKY